ncbi:MAG: TIGR01777 family oxidoreductase [Pyrinomonadaceae bacterium]|nr:TIGR01777 family oxidoreductase [Pyrinomonadaceae bacterium]
MKVLITGASGFIGGRLVNILEQKGHDVFKLSRSQAENPGEIQWDPYEGFSSSEFEKLHQIEAVIHLAGENVAGNWSENKKRRIRDSRVKGTETLVDAFSKSENPPSIFISASAIGFYGNRGDELLTEESDRGEGFFPEVCSEWEREGSRAAEFGARVVHPRIGVVLAKDGGALEKMLTPFKFGVGGTIGSGDQYMSWIAIDDLVNVFVFALENESVSGAVNATAPNPATNEEFTSTLGKVLSRPTIIPIPAFGVKLLFGEMGETLLLEGNRVIPSKLEKLGFSFKFPKLDDALKHVVQ